MSEIKLRSCPFCEGEATNIERYDYSAMPLHWVECVKCSARTDTFLTEEEAIKAWNKRVERDT